MLTRTFAEHVADYAQAGWPCILPVPPAEKFPPPTGFTGAEGKDTDPLQLVEWAGSHPSHSIALRMPAGVIGIDVDQYTKKGKAKNGAATLAELEAKWGPLPPTWSSTARGTDAGPGDSRIMLFRVPARRYVTKFTDVEIIQRHHRYAVVWPSQHSEAGGIYRWYTPEGLPADRVPSPGELAELPETWVGGLAEGATEQAAASADVASGERLLAQLAEDWRPECADLTSARLVAVDELLRADAGSRHDTMTGRVHHIVQLAAGGHAGGAYAIEALRQEWTKLTEGEDRGEEFERMLLTSARKAVTVVGDHQVPRDPCLLMQGFTVPGAAPGTWVSPDSTEAADPEAEADGVAPARWWSAREFIGTHAFDPVAQLDQPLAQAVLERTYPVLRYAYDSKGWLLRVPDRWELHDSLADWAVAQVASLMPHGNPGAEKDSDEFARDKRRARFNTNAGARAIAGKMHALVAGGLHPCTVKLAELDSTPTVLWAGGVAWDLRKCHADAPLSSWTADVDPATPHMHTASVLPERIETPLWDAFLEAVWPDPEVRAWALRVLSIALTGYADKALPIMKGERDRGKTQVVVLLMSVLGTYAHAADPRLLGTEGAKAHQSIVFALKGRRLSFIDEGPREGKFAQERIKQLTGGGALTANQMNQNPITFEPTHTLILTSNDDPILTDPAVRSRVRLIPCEGDPEQVIAARAAIGHPSSAAWRAEAPGVLARMMSEAAAWLADPASGTTAAAPEHIRYLGEHLAAEQDPVTAWLEDETEPFEQGTSSNELYQAFRAYCQRQGVRDVPSSTKWGRTLTLLGYPAKHTVRGKRRELRIRVGDYIPGFVPDADGLAANPDGLLTGSDTNPSAVFPQVNPRAIRDADGSDGLENLFYAYAHAHTREEQPPRGGQPVNPSAADERGEPAEKPKRTRSAEAAAKAAATREAKRQEAIAEASGEVLPLPALVTRDGQVRGLELDQAGALLATLAGAAVTVDIENTGYPVGHRDYALQTVQLGNDAFAVVLDPDDPAQADLVRRTVEAAAALHAHSASADLVPIAHAGLGDAEAMWAKMFDTVIPAKLADPSSTGSDPGLKQLAPAVLGDRAVVPEADAARKELFKSGKWLMETKIATPVERSGWAQVNWGSETMLRYGGSDVLDTGALAKSLPWPEASILERERTAQRMTARIAHEGLPIDGDQVNHLLPIHRERLADAAARLAGFGVENPGSDQQVAAAAERLGAELPRTKTGRLSVAKGAIEQYGRAEGELGDFVRARLDYQKAETALGLFLEPYRLLVEHGDGRARPTVYTLGADTGRMSCVRPNLQQVPREGGFRACLTADPGRVLISADFSGVELRVAAALSQDPALIRMLEQGVDLHWEAARQVFGPNATKADRYDVKRGVFGWLYGGGAQTLAENMGVTKPVAQRLIDTMGFMLPGVTAWAHSVKRGVDNGHTTFPTYAGRVVHMPVKAPHAAPNYCIQGTARELLIDALMRWEQTRWGKCVLLPVHDELVVHVPEEDAEEATAALVDAMQAEIRGIPIIVEASEPSFFWKDSA